ncbi:MAG: hypothetical protein ACD_12C00454G0001 [uncultured bacterium]|nr:MAG: hypothetical protein ACD_12C00454G0001 [uncultured bacterium]
MILTDTDSLKLSTMYIPALLSRKIFLNGLPLVEQLGINTREREKQVIDFFNYKTDIKKIDKTAKRDFLYQRHINYIYLSKSGLTYQKLMQTLGLKLIYQNQGVLIYEVI